MARVESPYESILIKGGKIIPGFGEGYKPFRGDIYIEGDKIVHVGRSIIGKAELVVKARGHVVIPGLINLECNVYRNAMRTLGSNLDYNQWISRIKYPIAGELTFQDISKLTALSTVELAHSGVTTLVNCYDIYLGLDEVEEVIENIELTGLRCITALGIAGDQNVDEDIGYPEWLFEGFEDRIKIIEESIKLWSRRDLTDVWVSLLLPAFLSVEGWEKVRELVSKHGTRLHVHLPAAKQEYEISRVKTAGRYIQYLKERGMLSSKTNLVHCLHVNREEYPLLAETGASLVHTAFDDGFHACGIARIRELIDSGVNVGFGTGACWGFIEALRHSVLVQKAYYRDPQALTPMDALRMGTIAGARALGLSDKIGTIEPGKKADIVLINLRKPHLMPRYDIYSLILYHVCSSDVDGVIVNGAPVLLEGRMQNINEDVIINNVEGMVSRLHSIILKMGLL